ncbi:MAG: hypothetical protein WD557_16535 [Dehalococcoidia bacterium]
MAARNHSDPIADKLDVLIRLYAAQLVSDQPNLTAKVTKLEALGLTDRAELAIICGASQDTVRSASNKAKKARTAIPEAEANA